MKRTSVQKQNDFLENFHKVHIVVAELLDSQNQGQLSFGGLAKSSKKRGVVLK